MFSRTMDISVLTLRPWWLFGFGFGIQGVTCTELNGELGEREVFLVKSEVWESVGDRAFGAVELVALWGFWVEIGLAMIECVARAVLIEAGGNDISFCPIGEIAAGDPKLNVPM
jgi:hypothetical protein